MAKQDRDRLTRIAREFAELWRLVELRKFPDMVSACLPEPDDALFFFALQDLVAVDLRRRWHAGERVLLEEYADAVPQLTSFSTELIHDEYETRQQNDEAVTIDSYQQRFPEQFSELRKLTEWRTLGAPEETTRNSEPSTLKRSDTYLGRDSVLNVGGDYRLIRRIGRGQYGEVWRAEAPGGVHVALKIVNWPVGSKLTQMELRALELMKELRHPFLIALQAYWLFENQLVMALELADSSLEDHYRERRETADDPMSSAELLGFVSEAAEALDFLHDEGILHRDIKPANILLVQGHAKVGDFGVARLLGEGKQLVTSTLVGTALYMAPEVWNNQANRFTDQYALAATYAELRLDRPVYKADSQVEVMRLHMDGTPNLSTLPEREQKVLQRALAKDPMQRFPTCVEFSEALRATFEPPRPRRGDQPQRSVSRLWIALTAMLALGVCSAIAFLMFQPDPPAVLKIVAPNTITVLPSQSKQVEIFVDGLSAEDPIELLVSPESIGDGDEKIELRFVEPPAGGSSSEAAGVLQVRAATNAPLTEHSIRLVAKAGGQQLERSLKITIDGSNINCPAEFSPVSDSTRRLFRGRLYHGTIAPNKIKLPTGSKDHHCVLILPGKEELSVPFYMLVHKVTVRLFRQFAQNRPESVKSDDWQKTFKSYRQNDERIPVMSVAVLDAARFAQWFGGRLPRQIEWNKAAGFWDRQGQLGPYQGMKPFAKDDIGLGRMIPLAIHLGVRDRSPLGCRHMAGNGMEWTSSGVDDDLGNRVRITPETKLSQNTKVILRGRSQLAPSPLTYNEMRDEAITEVEFHDKTSPVIGFRVLIPVR